MSDNLDLGRNLVLMNKKMRRIKGGAWQDSRTS